MLRGGWHTSVLCGVLLLAGCGRIGFDPNGGPGTGDGRLGDNGGPGNDGDPAASTPYNIVFVTSTSSRLADLGGLAGADTTCNQLAMMAGLSGTYVAWMSDAGTTAVSRLGSARGWIRRDGKPIVDSISDLVAGKMLYPILLTETGTALTGQFGIITATNGSGAHVEDCTGFTSTASSALMMTGIASQTFTTWTENFAGGCDQSLPMYCFGIDKSAQLQYPAAIGRRAFVTAASWPPSGGTSGADTTCQAAADAKTLGGTWRALIATTTVSAASRFSATGSPWVRLDGIPLAPTPDVLLNGQVLDAPLNLTETGSYRGSNPAQTGATSTTALGAANSTCLDWSDATGANTQRVGLLNSITLYFSTPIFQTCSSGGQLYCLEP
jgi:hypothetical protein